MEDVEGQGRVEERTEQGWRIVLGIKGARLVQGAGLGSSGNVEGPHGSRGVSWGRVGVM